MVPTVIKIEVLCMPRDEPRDYLIIDWVVAGVKVA
jgi:hypothetical protein